MWCGEMCRGVVKCVVVWLLWCGYCGVVSMIGVVKCGGVW